MVDPQSVLEPLSEATETGQLDVPYPSMMCFALLQDIVEQIPCLLTAVYRFLCC